jgi:ABC-type antimicrobial peptide transport system permease subunit
MFGIRRPGGAAEVRVVVNLVSTGYFETLGIGLRDGRLLTDAEQHGSEPVAVVNQPLANLIAPSAPVVGTTFPYSERTWRIVGVVEGARGRQLRQPAMPELFIPWRMAGRRPQAIAVRVDGDPLALLPAIARQIHEVDPSAPLADVATLDSRLADAMRAETFRAALLGTLAALALGLAALGAYSVTAFAVARRRREYGIRLALGERPGSILRRAIRTTATPTLIGTALGLAAALAAGRWLAPFLYETPVADVRVLAGTAALMIAISTAAALGSARDAARTDPIGVLKME